MHRIWMVILCVLALVASACGDDADTANGGDDPPTDGEAADTGASDDGDSTGEDGEDGGVGGDDEPEPVEAFDSWTGATADTIRVGAATIAFERLQEVGVDIEGIGSDVWAPAWAAAFNERGGAHGREMEIVARDFLPVGSVESDAVCAELTEDEEVFVVIGAMLGDDPLCITELHETPYVGMFGLTADRAERSIAPFFSSGMAEDDLTRGTVRTLIDAGTFDDARLAVWWEEAQDPVANDVVIPLLEDAGVDVVATGTLRNFADDAVASSAAADTIFQNFAANGADLYLNLSGLVPFNRAIDRNNPGVPFVLINGQVTNDAIVATSGYDPAILEDAIAVTAAQPTLEESRADEGWNTCVDEINDHSPGTIDKEAVSSAFAQSVAQACQAFRLLERLLLDAGVDLTPEALVAAADAAGEIDLPGMPAASLGPGKYSAQDTVRFYTYDAELQSMVPDGDPIVTTD